MCFRAPLKTYCANMFHFYHILQFFVKYIEIFSLEYVHLFCDILISGLFFSSIVVFYKSAFHQIFCPKELKNYKLHFGTWNLVEKSKLFCCILLKSVHLNNEVTFPHFVKKIKRKKTTFSCRRKDDREDRQHSLHGQQHIFYGLLDL